MTDRKRLYINNINRLIHDTRLSVVDAAHSLDVDPTWFEGVIARRIECTDTQLRNFYERLSSPTLATTLNTRHIDESTNPPPQ